MPYWGFYYYSLRYNIFLIEMLNESFQLPRYHTDFARHFVLFRLDQSDRNFALHCSMLVVIGLLGLICQRIYVVYVVEIIQHADPL